MRADCHVHIDKIGGPHKTVPPSVEMFTTYARREDISLFFVIYEKDETLARFRATGYDMVPIYWERTPLAPAACQRSTGLLPAGPGYPALQRLLVALLYEARQRVVITTPYFIPDEPLLQAMETAVLRGVEVHLVVSKKMDQCTLRDGPLRFVRTPQC